MKMPESPIRKLVPMANEAKARGIKVYHLNIGQPDIPTPDVGLEALRQIDRKVLGYSPSDGLLSLREKMAEYYRRVGIDVTPDEIFITTGASEAVLFSFLACLDPGDEILIPEPAYANYMSMALTCGATVKTVPSSIDNGFALPSIDRFEEAITPRTKAILLCNPNNPTGYVYTREELGHIRDLVRRHDLFLFSDEVYREFRYTDAPYVSSFHLEGIEQNVVMCDSMSKRYSECGIRIGAIVTRNRHIRKCVMKWGQARLSPPLLGQLVAEASIDAPEAYLHGVYDEYLQRRNFLVERLNKIPGCYSPMPMGAFYTMAKLPVDDADKFCAWCLSDFSHEGQTVMMAPASGFYVTPGYGRNEVRIAYVLERAELARALDVLEVALQAYREGWSKH